MTHRFILLLTLALLACAERGQPELDGDATQAPGSITTPRLDARVEAEPQGGELLLRLRVANPTARPITLEFSSGQRYDFAVYDASGEHLWLWSAAALFPAEPGVVTLRPGEALEYEERWAPTVPTGRLVVEAKLTSSNLPVVRRAEFTL